jgi:hypothetical protein
MLPPTINGSTPATRGEDEVKAPSPAFPGRAGTSRDSAFQAKQLQLTKKALPAVRPGRDPH